MGSNPYRVSRKPWDFVKKNSDVIPNIQYFTLPHGFQRTPTGMLEFHLESAGMVGIYHSAGFRWNPSGIPFQQIPSSFRWIPRAIPTGSNPFHGPFQPIPTHSNPFQPIPWAIPTHSNTFQHIPTDFMGHSNTFQVEFYSNGCQVPSKCHVT